MPLVSLRLSLSAGCLILSGSFLWGINTSPGASEINSFYRAFDAFGMIFRELIYAVSVSEINSPIRVFNTFGLVLRGNNTSPGASEITSFYQVFYALGSLSKIDTSQRPLRSIFPTKQYYFRVDLT